LASPDLHPGVFVLACPCDATRSTSPHNPSPPAAASPCSRLPPAPATGVPPPIPPARCGSPAGEAPCRRGPCLPHERSPAGARPAHPRTIRLSLAWARGYTSLAATRPVPKAGRTVPWPCRPSSQYRGAWRLGRRRRSQTRARPRGTRPRRRSERGSCGGARREPGPSKHPLLPSRVDGGALGKQTAENDIKAPRPPPGRATPASGPPGLHFVVKIRAAAGASGAGGAREPGLRVESRWLCGSGGRAVLLAPCCAAAAVGSRSLHVARAGLLRGAGAEGQRKCLGVEPGGRGRARGAGAKGRRLRATTTAQCPPAPAWRGGGGSGGLGAGGGGGGVVGKAVQSGRAVGVAGTMPGRAAAGRQRRRLPRGRGAMAWRCAALHTHPRPLYLSPASDPPSCSLEICVVGGRPERGAHPGVERDRRQLCRGVGRPRVAAAAKGGGCG
jgi:hypothetical protein